MKTASFQPPSSWEELAKHPDFIGGDVQIDVDEKTTFRGPLEKITVEGTMMNFHSPWMAKRKITGTGRVTWHRCKTQFCYANTMIHRCHIGELTGAVVVIDLPSRETPFKQILIYPRWAPKLKPADVRRMN